MREQLCGFSRSEILSQDYRISMINPRARDRPVQHLKCKSCNPGKKRPRLFRQAQALRPNRHRRMAKSNKSSNIRPPLENTFTVECPL